MNKILVVIISLLWCVGTNVVVSQEAKWIYYPGDFEIFSHRKINLQRTERNQSYPPIWRLDSPYGAVLFRKSISLKKPEKISLYADGEFYIKVNGKLLYDFDPAEILLPAGKSNLDVMVENFTTVPSLLIQGESIASDSSWSVQALDGKFKPVSVYASSLPLAPPSSFALSVEPRSGVCIEKGDNYRLYDFGRNTFGFPVLHNISGDGQMYLYYGESKEEANAQKLAETWDVLSVKQREGNDTLSTKAFRYVKVEHDHGVSFDSLSMLYEYLPVKYRGAFSCSDSLLNRIYETSLYTLHLTTRECHLDGIKRDRWVWSGDALQSYWMNFYSFFDEDVNKRTIWGLRGHSPVSRHMNTILDYSFYWIIGVESHFEYTADSLFVRQIYPRVKETMDYCIGRLNENMIAEGQKEDWVFIDWAPITKEGEVSFEQLLFLRALMAMQRCAVVAEDKSTLMAMDRLYTRLMADFERYYWSEQKQVYMHRRVNGNLTDEVTRYTNMFAVLFNMIDGDKKEKIKENVLLNSDILNITTPYMKFYELAALCEVGEHRRVLEFVKSYWGGMLRLGATTFWEAYDPTLQDNQHYDMYDRPFGKSLCHAWGANPIYLIGKYYLGVRPISAGYSTYEIAPNLAGLEWMKGKVPTPNGDIQVELTQKTIQIVTPAKGTGQLIIQSKTKPTSVGLTFVHKGNGIYTCNLDKNDCIYQIKYRAK